MHTLYLVSVWLHILAATAWVGGMFFLMLVVVPWLRQGDRALAASVLRATGTRFRNVGWACFAIVFITGSFNLWMRGVRLENFVQLEWLRSGFGAAVVLKLALFVVVLTLSAFHDFVLGPMAARAVEANPRSTEAEALRKRASWMGRGTAVLALVLVALAVVIVRGWP